MEKYLERRQKSPGKQASSRHVRNVCLRRGPPGAQPKNTAGLCGGGRREQGALGARRWHGHRLTPDCTGAVGNSGPRQRQRNDLNFFLGLAREHEFRRGAFEWMWRLLTLRFFRLGDRQANLARLARIEGLTPCRADRQSVRIAREHLRPGENLHGVPDRAIGANPGEDQAANGKSAPHRRQRGQEYRLSQMAPRF
jgi:hypothetical protein